MADIPVVGSLVVRGHTPGTWSVSRDGVPFGGNDINVVSKTYRKCINADHVIASIRTVSDQWEANANLIAAAPELLAALKQCREALLDICHNPAFADDAPEFNKGGIGYEACSVSIVAINKAEGRTA